MVWVMTLSGGEKIHSFLAGFGPAKVAGQSLVGCNPPPQGMRGDTGLAAHYPIRHWTKHFSLQHELQGQQTCRLGLHAHACAQGHSIVKFA